MAELWRGCHTTQDWSFQMQPGTQNAEYSHYWRSAERVLSSRSLEIPMELFIHRSIQHLILVCFPEFKASKITELHLLTKPHFYFQEAQTFILRGECYKIVFVNCLFFYFARFFDMFKAQTVSYCCWFVTFSLWQQNYWVFCVASADWAILFAVRGCIIFCKREMSSFPVVHPFSQLLSRWYETAGRIQWELRCSKKSIFGLLYAI